MSDEPVSSGAAKSRMRSPAYPSFGLGEAIKRAQMVWDAQRKNDGHLDSVIHSMGYNGANGASLRAVGAMNHYGMFEEAGGKGNRRIRLSELAQDILHLPEGDTKRTAALRTSALSPTIHKVLWERYQQVLPKDDVIKGFLVREKSYSPEAASDVIRNYRESFAVARLHEMTDSKPEEALEDTSRVSSDQKPVQTAPKDIPGQPSYQPPPAHFNPPPIQPSQSSPVTQELPILVDHGQIARIPFPMSEDAYDLLLATLQLWKKKLISPHPVAGSAGPVHPDSANKGQSQG